MSREKIFTRYTEEEFLRLVDYFIDERYSTLDISKFEGETYKEMSKYKWNLDAMKPEINNKQNMFEIRLLKLKIISASMEDWKNWSLKPQNAASIIFKILVNRYFDIHNVCLTYICSVDNNLSEEMIDDIVFINSELFDFEYWDDYHVNAVSNIIAKAPKYNAYNDLLQLLEDPLIADKCKDKIKKLIQDADNDLVTKINKIYHDIKQSRNLIFTNDKLIRVTSKELEIYRSFDFDLDHDNLDDDMTLNSEFDRLITTIEKSCPGFDEVWWDSMKKEYNNLYDIKAKSLNRILSDKYVFIMGLGGSLQKKINDCRNRINYLNNSINRNEKIQKTFSSRNASVVLYDGIDWKAVEMHHRLNHECKNKYMELFKAPTHDVNDEDLINAGTGNSRRRKNKE